MARSQLRVYYGPVTEPNASSIDTLHVEKETVTISLGDVFPMLADAVQSQRTWLQDFADDEITISSDLYEVILAYQHYRRPVA